MTKAPSEAPAGPWFKVLKDGASCHSGDLIWSLPTQAPDNTWTPGDWHEVKGKLVLCENGLHLTREPAKWWLEGAACYAVEWDGPFVGPGKQDGGAEDDKIAVRRARLIRKLSDAELVEVRVFVAGTHQIRDGVAVASGNSQVRASGNSQVRASGNSQVEASGNSQVRAFGNSQVRASGNSQVRASGNSQVRAFGNSQVEASDNSQVRAFGNSQVRAFGNSQVRASGNSQVEASGNSQVEASDNSQVRAFGNSQVEASDNSQVRASGNSQVEASDNSQVRAFDNSQVRASGNTTIVAYGDPSWHKPKVVLTEKSVWVDRRNGVPVIHLAPGLEAKVVTDEAVLAAAEG